MSLKDQFIDRFGVESLTERGKHGRLRFEMGLGDDNLTYLITALRRLNTVLDDLGFKNQPIGIAAYCYTFDSRVEEDGVEETEDPLHQQLLPFARELAYYGLGRFSRSEYLRLSIPPDEGGFYAYHFSESSIDLAPGLRKMALNDLNPDGEGSLSQWILERLIQDVAQPRGPLYEAHPILFNVDLGIMMHPYDVRGMDVFGPNIDLLKMLYNKRNTWLLDYDRERMDELYKD